MRSKHLAAAAVFLASSIAGSAWAQTTRLSQAPDGTPGDGDSFQAVISANGRFAAFCSAATNLVTGDTNGVIDVFVRDLDSSAIERVSVASDGTQANRHSCMLGGGLSGSSPASVSITLDGRFVAFSSQAANLLGAVPDTNGVNDIFVHDRVTRETTRVSVADDGRQITDLTFGNFGSLAPLIWLMVASSSFTRRSIPTSMPTGAPRRSSGIGP